MEQKAKEDEHPYYVLDCGSLASRLYRFCLLPSGHISSESLWNGPALEQVLSEPHHARVAEFVYGVASRVTAPCYVGATGGLRQAMEQGALYRSDSQGDDRDLDGSKGSVSELVCHLQKEMLAALPPLSEFSVLSGRQEAEYEFRAVAYAAQAVLGPDTTIGGMISVGGASSQVVLHADFGRGGGARGEKGEGEAVIVRSYAVGIRRGAQLVRGAGPTADAVAKASARYTEELDQALSSHAGAQEPRSHPKAAAAAAASASAPVGSVFDAGAEGVGEIPNRASHAGVIVGISTSFWIAREAGIEHRLIAVSEALAKVSSQ